MKWIKCWDQMPEACEYHKHTFKSLAADISKCWISIKDKLPRRNSHIKGYNKAIIIAYDLDRGVVLAVIDDSCSLIPGGYIVYDTSGGKLCNITHWMPLPEPPAGELL